MMEAVRTFETPVYFKIARRCIPKGCLHIETVITNTLPANERGGVGNNNPPFLESSQYMSQFDVQSCLLGYTAV
jgi:hypothetical protein